MTALPPEPDDVAVAELVALPRRALDALDVVTDLRIDLRVRSTSLERRAPTAPCSYARHPGDPPAQYNPNDDGGGVLE
jgi:hypothetical protein